MEKIKMLRSLFILLLGGGAEVLADEDLEFRVVQAAHLVFEERDDVLVQGKALVLALHEGDRRQDV